MRTRREKPRRTRASCHGRGSRTARAHSHSRPSCARTEVVRERGMLRTEILRSGALAFFLAVTACGRDPGLPQSESSAADTEEQDPVDPFAAQETNEPGALESSEALT